MDYAEACLSTSRIYRPVESFVNLCISQRLTSLYIQCRIGVEFLLLLIEQSKKGNNENNCNETENEEILCQ